MQETLERTKLRKPEVLKPSSKRLCVWFQETDQADMFQSIVHDTVHEKLLPSTRYQNNTCSTSLYVHCTFRVSVLLSIAYLLTK
jgi:hypothetical protein